MATRVEILKSAATAFRRFGYHGATVEHIAAALRMKKGNLYYYYRSKEEILFACHQYSLDRLLALVDAVERAEAAPDQKLRQLIVCFVHIILDELHSTALFLDLEALSPAHRKAIVARRDEVDRGVRRIVREGCRIGVRTTRRKTALVCDSRRGELDSPLVRPPGALEQPADRRALRRLPGRRIAPDIIRTCRV